MAALLPEASFETKGSEELGLLGFNRGVRLQLETNEDRRVV